MVNQLVNQLSPGLGSLAKLANSQQLSSGSATLHRRSLGGNLLLLTVINYFQQ